MRRDRVGIILLMMSAAVASTSDFRSQQPKKNMHPRTVQLSLALFHIRSTRFIHSTASIACVTTATSCPAVASSAAATSSATTVTGTAITISAIAIEVAGASTGAAVTAETVGPQF